jgi:hypothetical protein
MSTPAEADDLGDGPRADERDLGHVEHDPIIRLRTNARPGFAALACR